jgi:hypothetical protein
MLSAFYHTKKERKVKLRGVKCPRFAAVGKGV